MNMINSIEKEHGRGSTIKGKRKGGKSLKRSQGCRVVNTQERLVILYQRARQDDDRSVEDL